MQRYIESVPALREYLAPMTVPARNGLDYSLHTFKSRIALELLQIRMRKQAQVVAGGEAMVPVNVRVADRALTADLEVLRQTNAWIGERVCADPVFQITLIRKFISGLEAVAEISDRVERGGADGLAPIAWLLAYVDYLTSYQALDSLKFCLTEDMLRQHLGPYFPGSEQNGLELLLTPGETSIFNRRHLRQLRLLFIRLTGTAEEYRKARSAYRKELGFLEAEDLDFADSDTDEFVDAKMEAMSQEFGGDPSRVQAELEAFEVTWQRTARIRREAMNRFLLRIEGVQADRIRLFNLLNVWLALVRHQEWNRFHKMRFFRNLDTIGGRRRDRDQVGLLEMLAQDS